MADNIKIESGLQLLARLTKKSDSYNMYPSLFVNGLEPNDVVEITGENNSGKSFLLIDAIIKTLFPDKMERLAGSVLIFNTDGNLSINSIIDYIEHKLENNSYAKNKEALKLELLNKLFLINIYDAEQLYITLENLDNILVENPNIMLIIFDTITAFYWSEQVFKLMKMDSYIQQLLKQIQKHINVQQIPIIYTRPFYFGYKSILENFSNKYINYRIHIATETIVNEVTLYKVILQSHQNNLVKYFNIEKGKILWK